MDSTEKHGIKKGSYGYLNKKHGTALLKSILFCGFTVFLVLCGRVFFRPHAKLFIILAIISAIPSAMTLVSFIMYERFKTGREEVFQAVEAVRREVPVFYDAVITTSEKSYAINCLVALNKNLLIYSEYGGINEEALLKHLENMAKKNGFKDWNIRFFKELDKFLDRISYLMEKEVKVLKQDREMMELIGSISL